MNNTAENEGSSYAPPSIAMKEIYSVRSSNDEGGAAEYQTGAESPDDVSNDRVADSEELERKANGVRSSRTVPSDTSSDSESMENGSHEETEKFLDTRQLNGDQLMSPSSADLQDPTGGNNLFLYGDPGKLMAAFLKGFTVPGPRERAETKKKKANLGVMLGVYLPTIQHILGVTMFIRLFWVVGIAGVTHTFILLALCCVCTFLTSISVSAVATNGEVKAGGAYFMISRNLGPEFGSAVGFLFYLANAVATAMYLVGGVEILLIYIFPDLTIGGKEVHSDTGIMGMMSHNLRLYSTLLLLVEFAIVAMGVRFVQLLAPVSLMCVILSILACYAGGIEKSINPEKNQHVCMYGDHLLQAHSVLPPNATLASICDYCNSSSRGPHLAKYCGSGGCYELLRCVNAFPGFSSKALIENLPAHYMGKDEYLPGRPADKTMETFQDVHTTFFVLLAIYFPAVTGILTGANMSGDLKDSSSSIPMGTIAAQLTTSFIYFSLALVFGAAIDGNVLRDKYGRSLGGGMVVAHLAWPSHWVLLVGSFTSTLGAALQCLCSAPRLLQALAKDDVIPILRPFAKVTKSNEPFNGLLLSTVIAELAILLGAMDHIAAVVDFFFLMCYAFVNLICALYSLMRVPNWRPRFKYYHWSLALVGAFLCFFIMFSTHWDYALVSCALCAVIYKYVEWKGAKKEWGDGIRGLALTTAQYSIMKVEDKDPHPKNFRPQFLLLFSMIWSTEVVDVRYARLLQLASQMKAGRGLSIVASFIRGDPLNTKDREAANRVKLRMDEDMAEFKLRGFSKTIIYGENQITGSLSTLIQSVGMGGLRPNTVLLKWPTHSSELRSAEMVDSEYETFIDKMHAAVAMDMCLIVAKNIIDFPSMKQRLNGLIDVYWIVQDGGLCILIAYLLNQHKVWRRCKIRVIAIAQEHDNNVKMQADLQNYVYKLRIDATILVVELSDPEISKNAFEQTLLMEERIRLNQEMGRRFSAARPPVGTVTFNDRFEVHRTIGTRLSMDDLLSGDGIEEENEADGDVRNVAPHVDSYRSYNKRPGMHLRREVELERKKRLKALDKQKVHKMHTAVRLNELILEHSCDSDLVMLNLPKPPVHKKGMEDYTHYLEVLSDNVKRVLFVRGTGNEKLSTVS